ncbi:hypothetical protein [Gordonia lacunae]|uniref:DUF732 domain-containing protein n=1 Tax=Gordonia lacunae TaxID=417102 RepID=A0A243QEC1_9ACTN|nr:hypothetical protein [Gordonia lacunae]OUC80082.1 hypothetical protein CA982_05170 [Gordonia lacunae]
MIDARRTTGVGLIGVIAAVLITAACATETSGTAVPEVSPIAQKTTESAVTSTATTTTAPAPTSRTTRPPVGVPPQAGAATDPDEMTCGTYLSLTDSEQIATITAFADRHGKELVKSNPNSYLLVRAFCVGDPDMLLKDNLLLQGS